MKLSFHQERVLAVTAHPDDAELLCAGTLARAKADGAAVGLCILCKGDKGHGGEFRAGTLAAVRRQEAKASARLLGAQLFFGGFADGTLADGLKERRRLIEIMRRFRPTLLIGHSVLDYHPDHQNASRLTQAASWFSASAGQATRSKPLPSPPALWFMDTLQMSAFEPHFYIDITPHYSLKKRLLACHRSQLARGQELSFADLAELMRAQSAARGAQAGVSAAEAFQAHQSFKRTRAW